MTVRMVHLAKKLRQQSTDAERSLWADLRAKQMLGLKFRRQVPIGNYIVDLVCFSVKLVIELDGGQHAERIKADQIRENRLVTQGFTILRFWNHEVFENKTGVLETIMNHCIRKMKN